MSTWQPGTQTLTVETARYQVRHQIRDGVPALDANPVPFEIVRLEDLSDQIVQQATPASTVFQLRFQNVPLEQFVTVNACPGTLVAFVDGWTPTAPVVDVDQNGNFTLPVAPVASLKITYGWQFFTDSSIDNYVDDSRQWLREFPTLTTIPDALQPAVIYYAASLALSALARQLTLASVKAGTAQVDLNQITGEYEKQATDYMTRACQMRNDFYSRGPEKLAPDISVIAPSARSWTPRN